MFIRHAVPDDAPAISRLAALVIDAHPLYAPGMRQAIRGLFAAEAVAAQIDADPGSHIVAETEGVVGGVTVLHAAGGVAHSQWTLVAPGARNARVGHRMFDAVIAEARRRGCHKITGNSLVSDGKIARHIVSRGGRVLCVLENHWYHQDYESWELPVADAS